MERAAKVIPQDRNVTFIARAACRSGPMNRRISAPMRARQSLTMVCLAMMAHWPPPVVTFIAKSGAGRGCGDIGRLW